MNFRAEGSIPSAPAMYHRSRLRCSCFAACFPLYLVYQKLIVRVLAKPTGCIISSPPCASGLLSLQPSVMPTDSPSCIGIAQNLILSPIWKEKSIEVDLIAQTGCFRVCDGCAGMFPFHKPESRITNDIQFSSCRIYRGDCESRPIHLGVNSQSLPAPLSTKHWKAWQIWVIVLQWTRKLPLH